MKTGIRISGFAAPLRKLLKGKPRYIWKIPSLEICISHRHLCCFIPDLFLFFTLGLLSWSASEFYGLLFRTKSIWETRENFYFSFCYLHLFFSDSKNLGQAGKPGSKCIDFRLCSEILFYVCGMLSWNLSHNKNRAHRNADFFIYNTLM